MEQVNLALSESQQKKLLNGDTIQVKHEDIGEGVPYMFSTRNYNALLKAYNSRKGTRISFTQAEAKANRMTGGGWGKVKKFGNKVGRNIKNGAQKAENTMGKVDTISRKIDNTIQKIDDEVDKYSYLQYTPGPVGDIYSGIAAATEGASKASAMQRKAVKKANEATKDFNELAHTSRDQFGEKLAAKASKYIPTEEEAQQMYGSGNPYVNAMRRNTTVGGSFKGGSFKGGSFKTGGSFKGGSFKTGAGAGSRPQAFGQHTTISESAHNPIESRPFKNQKCPYCGK